MTTSVVFRNAQESSLFETYSFMNTCPFKWKRTSNSYAPNLYIRWVNSLPPAEMNLGNNGKTLLVLSSFKWFLNFRANNLSSIVVWNYE